MTSAKHSKCQSDWELETSSGISNLCLKSLHHAPQRVPPIPSQGSKSAAVRSGPDLWAFRPQSPCQAQRAWDLGAEGLRLLDWAVQNIWIGCVRWDKRIDNLFLIPKDDTEFVMPGPLGPKTNDWCPSKEGA